MLDQPTDPERILHGELTAHEWNVILVALQHSDLPHRAVVGVLRKIRDQIATQDDTAAEHT
jgi:hypothetical protein